MKNYKVYLIKDREDNIVYAGLTGGTLQRRFDDHICRRPIYKDKHKIELVQEYLTLEEASILEKMLIEQYDLTHKGLNKSLGTSNGCSVIHTEETKEHLSNINLGKKVSEERAAKNRIARLGTKNSEYHNKRISETHSIAIICLETGKIYPSIRKAAQELDLQATKISLVCNGKRKSTGKLHFRYHMKR